MSRQQGDDILEVGISSRQVLKKYNTMHCTSIIPSTRLASNMAAEVNWSSSCCTVEIRLGGNFYIAERYSLEQEYYEVKRCL